jgi:hypothetical protein
MTLNTNQTLDLEARCRERFKDLTTAEIKLIRAATTQEYAVCGPNMQTRDPANDPTKAADWHPHREVRAELVRWMCVDQHAKQFVDPAGIQLYGAKISNDLDLSNVALLFPVSFRNCGILGELNLGNAHVPELDLEGSCVQSVYGYQLKVPGSMYLRNGFCATGDVRIFGAEVGGNLECDHGDFQNGLQADGIRVSGSVFLREGFRASGEVRLVSAVIEGNLECGGGHFQPSSRSEANDGGINVNANGIIVKGDVYLRDGFRCEGAVEFVGAQIGGDLDCTGGRLGELDARRAVIKGALFWRSIVDPAITWLNLSDASAYAFFDDSSSWPSKGKLHIDGFTYTTIFQLRTHQRSRLEWLASQAPFTPQPYRQLAKVLSDSGQEDEAQEILVRMQQLQRAQHWYQGPESLLLRWSVGYGYHPLWAFWELVGLAGLGWIIYRRAQVTGTMTPTDRDAYESFKTNGAPPGHYPRFAPFVYSVENSLPLVKLGQADRWQPDPRPRHSATSAKGWWSRFRCVLESSTFVRCFLWIQIILGWILATLFAAGVTGIIRR